MLLNAVKDVNCILVYTFTLELHSLPLYKDHVTLLRMVVRNPRLPGQPCQMLGHLHSSGALRLATLSCSTATSPSLICGLNSLAYVSLPSHSDDLQPASLSPGPKVGRESLQPFVYQTIEEDQDLR
jgi:hypothetical protein